MNKPIKKSKKSVVDISHDINLSTLKSMCKGMNKSDAIELASEYGAVTVAGRQVSKTPTEYVSEWYAPLKSATKSTKVTKPNKPTTTTTSSSKAVYTTDGKARVNATVELHTFNKELYRIVYDYVNSVDVIDPKELRKRVAKGLYSLK